MCPYMWGGTVGHSIVCVSRMKITQTPSGNCCGWAQDYSNDTLQTLAIPEGEVHNFLAGNSLGKILLLCRGSGVRLWPLVTLSAVISRRLAEAVLPESWLPSR